MNEQGFRAQLTKAELEARAFIVSFKIMDFELLERLNRYSEELNRTLDELINFSIQKLMDDIEAVHNLRD